MLRLTSGGDEEQLMAKRIWIMVRRKGVVRGRVLDRGADRQGRKRLSGGGQGGGAREEQGAVECGGECETRCSQQAAGG